MPEPKVKLTGKPVILVIGGPTASGKTKLAVRIAELLNGEIIGADSRQIYQGITIGTAKPSAEERRGIPYHLIDFLSPSQPFSAAMYADCAQRLISEILERGRLPILAGGTGLYLRAAIWGLCPTPAGDQTYRRQLREIEREQGGGTLHRLLKQVDPRTAARLSPKDLPRIERAMEIYRLTGKTIAEAQEEHGFREARYAFHYLGLTRSRPLLYECINRRVELMFKNGLEEEVRNLMQAGLSDAAPAMTGLGYRTVIRLLRGEVSRQEAIDEISQQTRQYAKRQLTWFRKEPIDEWIINDDERLLDKALLRISRSLESLARSPRLASCGEDSAAAALDAVPPEQGLDS